MLRVVIPKTIDWMWIFFEGHYAILVVSTEFPMNILGYQTLTSFIKYQLVFLKKILCIYFSVPIFSSKLQKGSKALSYIGWPSVNVMVHMLGATWITLDLTNVIVLTQFNVPLLHLLVLDRSPTSKMINETKISKANFQLFLHISKS